MRHQAIYDIYSNVKYISQDIAYDVSDNVIHIDESLVQAKIQELQSAEPLRLLRIERDRLLQQTDWRFRIDQEPSQAWYEYCQALRDLPQEIANGNIPAPTLNENGMLVFEHWPNRYEINIEDEPTANNSANTV